MTTTTKTAKSFDCVEFKRNSQERLRVEYEKRKNEFDSYVDFIKAKLFEDEWGSQLWKSIGEENSSPSTKRRTQ